MVMTEWAHSVMDKILLQNTFTENKIVPEAIYQYGSRVYGTDNEHSDWDFIVIDKAPQAESEILFGQYNIKIFGQEHYKKLLTEHNISALECYFLDEKHVIKSSNQFRFKLNKTQLKNSLMEKSSKSWVKAKKKFISPYDHQEDEIYRGKKSLFHSFRILMFGMQIAQHGRIENYSAANFIFHDIMKNESKIWKDYDANWRKPYNELCSLFRIATK